MEDNGKKELFETMPVPKAVAKMCVPAIIGSLVMMFYNLADTYFVGALNSAVQTSAVTLAGPALLIFNAVNNLFGVGSSSLLSRSLGVYDYDTARRTAAFGFWGAVVSGILFSLVALILRTPILHLLGADAETFNATSDYFFWAIICGAMPSILNVVMGYLVRAEGSAIHATVGMMSGCLLNIVLDPFFILPRFLGLGAAGAGLATFLSNCVAVIYYLVLLSVKRGRTYVAIHPKYLRKLRDLPRRVCEVGVPSAIQNLLNVTGQVVLNNFAAAYGAVVVSAVGISHRVVMIPVFIALGAANGIMPLISYNYASGNRTRMKAVLFFTLRIALAFTFVLMIGYFFASRGLMTVFIRDEAIVSCGSVFLKVLCPVLLFQTMDFLTVSVFQACGMGKRALLFAVLRKIVLEIPALFLWNALIPVYGLAAAQPTAELILAIASVFFLRRILSEPAPERLPEAR